MTCRDCEVTLSAFWVLTKIALRGKPAVSPASSALRQEADGAEQLGSLPSLDAEPGAPLARPRDAASLSASAATAFGPKSFRAPSARSLEIAQRKHKNMPDPAGVKTAGRGQLMTDNSAQRISADHGGSMAEAWQEHLPGRPRLCSPSFRWIPRGLPHESVATARGLSCAHGWRGRTLNDAGEAMNPSWSPGWISEMIGPWSSGYAVFHNNACGRPGAWPRQPPRLDGKIPDQQASGIRRFSQSITKPGRSFWPAY